MSARKNMICMDSPTLSIRRQCELLSVHRGGLYYESKQEKPKNVKMMHLMDRHLLHHPTEGAESMVLWLRDQGFPVGPKRIRRLFRLMGYQSIYRRKNLTKLGLREYIKPYLLRGLSIDRPNQVWCTDITYIPMRKGFMYLTAVMDVYSRKILAWGLSNSLEASWCVQILQSAIDRHGCPQIVNSDQGSQYTSALWTQFLGSRGIQISMDGKGRATDNTWIERFWKSLKHDYVYLNPCDDGFELFEGVQNHIEYYNQKIHHTTRQKPNDRFDRLIQIAA